MGLYLVERYLPGFTPEQLAAARARVRLATADLAAAGERVRYLGSTFVLEEESCFCQFEAPSAAVVERLCRRARVPYARIAEAHVYNEAREEQCASY